MKQGWKVCLIINSFLMSSELSSTKPMWLWLILIFYWAKWGKLLTNWTKKNTAFKIIEQGGTCMKK